MVGNVLQRAADDGIFVVERSRRLQAFFYAARVAQNGKQQQLQITADKIAAVTVRHVALVQNLAQKGRFLAGKVKNVPRKIFRNPAV